MPKNSTCDHRNRFSSEGNERGVVFVIFSYSPPLRDVEAMSAFPNQKEDLGEDQSFRFLAMNLSKTLSGAAPM
jgi:hypothetical protein